jgi:hypothetical protein
MLGQIISFSPAVAVAVAVVAAAAAFVLAVGDEHAGSAGDEGCGDGCVHAGEDSVKNEAEMA